MKYADELLDAVVIISAEEIVVSKSLILIGLLGLSGMAFSAPFPGESLLRPQSGLFWMSRGFKLGTAGTAWRLDDKAKASPLDWSEVHSQLDGATYSHVQFPTARLRVEVEDLKAKATLESYTKRWVRDYYQYGFKILATKPMKLAGVPTIVYDLLSRGQDVQIRQVIQVKNGRAVVLTCSDERKNFPKSVSACNAMAGKIEWPQAPTSADASRL